MRPRLLLPLALPAAAGCIVLVVQGPGLETDAGPTQEVTLPDGGVGYRLPDGGITHSLVEAVCTREPPDGGPGTTVYFDGSESQPSPQATALVAWFWEFGDGQDAGGPLLTSPMHVYETPGVYRAVLTVSDNSGASGSTQCPPVIISP